MKEIQRGKCPKQSCFKHQNEREIERDPLLNLRRRRHRHGDDYGRQEQHQQAQTVDAYVVLHAKCRNPAVYFLKLKAPEGGVESMPQDKGDRKRKKSKDARASLRASFSLFAPKVRTAIAPSSGTIVRQEMGGSTFIASHSRSVI